MKYYIYLFMLVGSILIVNQNAIAQATAPQIEQFQNRIVDSIFSTTLNESRDFWVRLPDNFQQDNDEKYAVIYLIDGFSLESTLQAVYANYWGHYLPHMILVGISNRNNRIRDLTTSQIKMRRGSAMNDKTGGAETFTNFWKKNSSHILMVNTQQ